MVMSCVHAVKQWWRLMTAMLVDGIGHIGGKTAVTESFELLVAAVLESRCRQRYKSISNCPF